MELGQEEKGGAGAETVTSPLDSAGGELLDGMAHGAAEHCRLKLLHLAHHSLPGPRGKLQPESGC